MNWDDIEVRVSDVYSGFEPHPTQLVYAATKIVQLRDEVRFQRSAYPEVRCRHRDIVMAYAVPMPVDRPRPFEMEIVPLRLYRSLFRLLGPGHPIHPEFEFINTVDSWWVMGLCSCGTLYWRWVNWKP